MTDIISKDRLVRKTFADHCGKYFRVENILGLRRVASIDSSVDQRGV